MIRSLAQLGKYSKNINKIDKLEEILDDLSADYYILIINFSETGEEYKGVILEEYDSSRKTRYLYKKGSPRGGDITPTSIYMKDEKEPEKSLNRYLQSLVKIDSQVFKNIYNYYSNVENKKTLLTEINGKIENKKKYALSLKIGEKYLGDFEECRKILEGNKSTQYNRRDSFTKDEKVSKAEKKRCYVCDKITEVNGFTNTFQFYTLDKPGFMTGGFNRKYAWRNYPVCQECGEILDIGQKYLREKFRGYFAGMNYFVIPNFIFNIDPTDNSSKYKKIIERLTDKTEIELANNRHRGITQKEDKILALASEMENSINFSIMFCEEQNAEFKILENIEDIFPSRIRKLYEVRDKIMDSEKYPEFGFIPTKKDQYEFEINFTKLKDYFYSMEKFLSSIHYIFADKKMDEQFILSLFIEKIRRATLNGEEFEGFTKSIESFMYLKFFKNLKLFKENNKGGLEVTLEKTEKNSIYLEFMEKHGEVLDTDLKRGVFLEGILVKKLLKLPEQQTNKQFYSRLNGLKLNEKIIKRIFTETVNKFNEYGKEYYHIGLKELISEYLLNANFKETTLDEMSYYFVLGMNIESRIKDEKIQEEELN